MKISVKLVLLLLSLGSAGLQASPMWIGTKPPQVVASLFPGALITEMTSTFGTATDGFSLHSALYDTDTGGAELFYQITNNAGSTSAILQAFNHYGIQDDTSLSFLDNWGAQTSAPFGSFVKGAAESDGVSGLVYGWGTDTVSHTTTNSFMQFTQYPIAIDIANMSHGITPGNSSFIGSVAANDGKLGSSVLLGMITVNGHEMEAYVSAVPEPEEYALMLAGLGVIGAVVRRRKAKHGSISMQTAFEGALA